jgi:uroporphyrin-III C-methyltransferase
VNADAAEIAHEAATQEQIQTINNFNFPVFAGDCIYDVWGQVNFDLPGGSRRHANPTHTGETLLSGPLKERKGKVYLVGAGPGDPDLLTVKAMRTLGLADVVLHDALVSQEVLALVPSRARILDVGKRCGRTRISQEEINDLLLRFASNGEIVVRLKSGDPLIFGRAGEELDVLREAGIEVEVVPGITAALAAAARIQVSLTDRRTADQLLVVSAHRGHGKAPSDWYSLLTNRTTVVVYMPGGYGSVAEDLRRAGLSASTPCAIVSKASNSDEQSHYTTLGLLDRAPLLPAPCVLIVGETVAKAGLAKLRSLCIDRVPLQADFGQPSETAPEF